MASLKSILDQEFRLLESKASGKKKKNLKKVSEELGSKRHGLKSRRTKIKNERLELSVPKCKLYLNSATVGDDRLCSNSRIEKNLENLMALTKFSGAKLSAEAGENIFGYNTKTKRYYEPKEKSMLENLDGKNKNKNDGEERATFTEDDFETLSKEYFCNSGQINRQSLETKKKKAAFF